MANVNLVPANTPFGYNVGINYESWEVGRTGYSITADLNQITQNFSLIRTYHDSLGPTPVMDGTQQQVITYVVGTSNVELVMGTNESAVVQGGYGAPWAAGLMNSSTYTDQWVQMLISSFGSVANVKAHLRGILLGNELDMNGPPPSDPSFSSYQGWINASFSNLKASMAAAGLGDIPISASIANYGNTVADATTSYIQSNWSSSWNNNSPYVMYDQYTQSTSLGPMSSTNFAPVSTYFQSLANTLGGNVDVYVGETGYSTVYNTPTVNNQSTVYTQIFSWLNGMESANNGKTVPLFLFDAFDQPAAAAPNSGFGIYAESSTFQPAGLKAGITLPSWINTPISALTTAAATKAVGLAQSGNLGVIETLVSAGLKELNADSGTVMNLVLTALNTAPDYNGSRIADHTSARVTAALADQGLATPGNLLDLIVQAAVVSPGAFASVGAGLDLSGSSTGGPGYHAVSNLGQANDLLLARAVSALLQGQTYFHTPDVLNVAAGDVAPVAQSLLFQPMLASDTAVQVTVGGVGYSLTGKAGDAHAWSAQFAQQALQKDFSADLVKMFDQQAQSTVTQMGVAAGSVVSVGIGGASTTTPQGGATTSAGFVDFVSASGTSAVHVAQAVAVAETVGAANDQTAIVRMRQGGAQDEHVTFYKVDDYSGSIGGLKPGDAGYDAASDARAYVTGNGSTMLTSASFGGYSEGTLLHVNAGDLVAMKLTSGGHTFYAFANANEVVDGAHVGHLWNYGMNTWGWEDLYGGGDHDYNDLVVQLDFTSASGSHLLV